MRSPAPSPTVTYTSAYTELYQREGGAGRHYDRSIRNRFELAIFELERRMLGDIFRRFCPAGPATRYLDFACGTGRILGVFAGMVRSKVGVDTSAGQLEVAREAVPDAELVHGNVVTQPDLLGGRRFDLITSFRLLLNLEPENRVPILRRLHDLLDDDGCLVVDNHMNRHSVLGVTAYLLHKVLGMPKKPNVPPGRRGIISTMTEAEVRRALGEAGFRVEAVYRLFVLPGNKSTLALPARWLVSAEAALARVPVLNRASKNQIFVCRKRESRAA